MTDIENKAYDAMMDDRDRWKAAAERLEVNGIHTCHHKCDRTACVLRRQNREMRAMIERHASTYEPRVAYEWLRNNPGNA